MQAASSDGNREDSSEATDAFLAFRVRICAVGQHSHGIFSLLENKSKAEETSLINYFLAGRQVGRCCARFGSSSSISNRSFWRYSCQPLWSLL